MRRLITLAIAFFPLIVTAELTDFYLEVTPKQGGPGDTYELDVVLEGPSADGRASPKLSGGDFKYTFVGPRSETSITNGEISRRLVLVFQLNPKTTGELTTPSAAITIDGAEYVANALKVTVSKTPSKNSDGVTFEQFLDQDSAFVGEQILYSIEVATLRDLFELRMDDVPFDGFWTEAFKDDMRSTRRIGGAHFLVNGTRRALYPMKTGQLTLPSRTLTAKIRERSAARSPFDPFNPFDDGFLNPLGSMMVARNYVAEEKKIQIKPLPNLPQSFTAEDFKYGIVGETAISSTLSNSQTTVGEPITFEVTLKSFGNLRPVQLSPNFSDTLKVYPEKPRINLTAIGDRYSMEKSFAFSLVPKSPGTFTIPPLAVGYFDPKTGEYQLLKTTAHSFTVTGSADSISSRPIDSAVGTSKAEADRLVEPETPKTAEQTSEAPELGAINGQQTQLPSWGLLSLLILVSGLGGWILRGTLLRAKTPRGLDDAKGLSELREIFSAELNTFFGLIPPANSWGLRAAVLRELSQQRELASEIVGILDDFDSALYSAKEISLENQRNRAKKALSSLKGRRSLKPSVASS